MKFRLVHYAKGLFKVEDDKDEGLMEHLRIGETYEAEVRLSRNPRFHRKYFKMIRTSWEMIPEEVQAIYRSEEGFRKFAEIAAGYYDPFISPITMKLEYGPKSIAYDKLDQGEFEELYMSVRMVLDTMLSRYITHEQFEEFIERF